MTQSIIETSEKGCAPGKGLGSMVEPNTDCGLPGASHGGVGGMGRQTSNHLNECDSEPMPPYGTDMDPAFEGSGSWIHSAKKRDENDESSGARGGGLVSVVTQYEFSNEGKIFCRGGAAKGDDGISGASGGAISLLVGKLSGQKGVFDVRGGSGSAVNSGGGGGGRFSLFFVNSID